MDFLGKFYGYHYTRIDDKKLGYLYYILLLVIIFYVIFYSIIYNKGWLVKEPLIGTITFDVHRNKKTDAIYLKSPYCKDTKCKVLNEYDVVYPKYERSFGITTALKDRVLKDNCNETYCVSEHAKGKNFYVADVENFEIKVEHSIQSKGFHNNDHSHSKYIKHHKEMVGFLIDKNKNVLKRFEKEDSDYLSIGLLLQAAGISLDQNCDVFDEEDKTLRDRGSILSINLEYHNVNGTDEFHYYYRVKRIPKTQLKTETLIREGDQDVARTRYGLLLRFRQHGWAEVTEITHIITVFGSSIGLISLASTIVYYIACYFMGYDHYFEKVVTITKDDKKNNKENQKPKQKQN